MIAPPETASTPASAASDSARSAPAVLVVLLATAVVVAATLWAAACFFPVNPWNDMRLAPSVAWARGLPFYSTATAGTINTWTYGPLPVLYFLPVAWAPSASSALVIGSLLNLALAVVPVALVVAWWPVAPGTSGGATRRAAAGMLCLALWPWPNLTTLYPDSLALALGLIGNLALVRGRSARALWLAAAAAAGAVACKQIALGIPLAQAVWLGATGGWRAGLRHVARCVAAGGVILAGAIALFGAQPLYFSLVEVLRPATFAPSIGARLLEWKIELTLYVGGPLLVFACHRASRRDPRWWLCQLAWACSLPFGLLGLLGWGGQINSVHSYALWLPPALTLLAHASWPAPRRPWFPIAMAVATVALCAVRLATQPAVFFTPATDGARHAAAIAARHPGAVWFPLRPLVTLYGDGRYYHDEDGLHVRFLGRRAPAREHVSAALPPDLRWVAYEAGVSDWGVARWLLPPAGPGTELGRWTLLPIRPDAGKP